MPINKLFGGNIALTGKALDLRMQKQGLIQSNIANMETPGYQAKDFSFAKAMEKAMTGAGELQRTHPMHLDVEPLDISKEPEISQGDQPVDLDEEMVKLSQNRLMYQVGTKIIAKNFAALQFVIDEGGK